MDNLHEFSNTNAPSEWRKSKYSLEERMKSLKVDRVREKRSVIQPFPSDFAEFSVPANSAKWFFCTKTEIELIRMKHGDLELFPQEDHELLERQKAALFIQRLGQELNLQRSIDTSIILMHRFYVLHPIQIFPYEVTAAAAVLLGSKTEDKKRLLSQIVQALIKVMKLESSNFNAYKLEVDQVEHFMALSLAFEFTLIHPSLYISKACEILNIGNNSELRTAIDDLSVNSLIFTTFCIRYPPELIAAFCIYSVLKKEEYKINHLHDGRPWFCSIDKNITLDMLDKMDFEFFTSKLQLPLDPFNQQEIAKSKVDFKRRFSSDDLSSSSNVTQSDDTQDSNNDECKSHSRVKFENERLQNSSVKHPQDIRRNFARLHNRPLSSLRHNQQSQTQLLLEDARFKFNGFNDLDSELPQAISQIRSFPPESKSKQAASIKKQKMSSDVNNNVAKLFKPSSSSSNSSEFNASTSGIKSTVPLKIKIAKPESKDSWSQQKEQHMKDLNNLIEPYETSYSSVKTKKRISHVKAVSSASEAETYFEHRRHYDEPVIHQVTHEEIVRYSPSSDHSQIFKHKKMKIEEFEETNHSAPVEMAKVDDNFSSSLDSKLEKKARKSKKHKKEKKRLKREKHMEKKKSKELMNNTNDNIKVSEPRRTPIKLLFKKSSGDGNYQVQNLQP